MTQCNDGHTDPLSGTHCPSCWEWCQQTAFSGQTLQGLYQLQRAALPKAMLPPTFVDRWMWTGKGLVILVSGELEPASSGS